MPVSSLDVLMTAGAERDLEAIIDYISEVDSPSRAAWVLDQLMQTVAGLAEFQQRGSSPKELLGLGIHEYRQALFKPYRVIYRIIEARVYIHVIVDGRRDMQTLLQRRLLDA